MAGGPGTGVGHRCRRPPPLPSPAVCLPAPTVSFSTLDLQGAPTPLPSTISPALQFEVVAQCGRARTARMTLPHYVCDTPMFMPVGTQGTTAVLLLVVLLLCC